MKILDKFFGKKKYTLVISGGGVRGFYGAGILKAIEECGIKKDIVAVYGVSAGAILAAYRSAGYSADEIFEKFKSTSVFGLKTINLLAKKSLLKNDFLLHAFERDLPKTFEKLQLPTYIGTTDIKKAKYILFSKGRLHHPLLASASIPVVFPPVHFQGKTLVDGGTINNFPVDIAKKKHPNHKIIGIFLNKFTENQSIDTVLKALPLTYEVIMRAREIEKLHLVDHLFYRDLKVSVLTNDKAKMKKLFDIGYKDGMKMFKHLK